MTDSAADNNTTKVCSYCHKSIFGEHKDCPGGAPAAGAAVTTMPDPLIGTIFAEKYEVLSVLGKGGMSLVYKARHKFMDRIVAVKVLLEHLVSDSGAVQRFQQESKAASTLNHQNIVTVYDFGQTPSGQAYFVMDCLEGQSLSDIIESDGRLAVPRALEIFEQICDGLEHAHQKGIIHRDLKPNNIVLMKNEAGQESIKIVDFGIAKIIGTDGTPQQRLTQTGEIFGSPFYMSPEQCQGLTLDSRSDLYSLGCLMFETLTGYPPQMGESFVATALKHINDQPPSFSEVAPSANIPRQVEYVIQRCLEKSPKDRFPSAEAIKQALMDAALAGGVPGLRAGAVKVSDAKSPMRQTWDKLGKVFDTGSYAVNKQKKKAVTAAKLVFVTVPILLLGIILPVMLFYPGPAEDGGTPWNKLMWQLHLSAAEWFGKFGDLKAARNQFQKAEELTKTFHDKSSRLLGTVQSEANVYRDLKDYDQVNVANDRLIEITTKEAEAGAKRLEEWLNSFHKLEQADPLATQGALQANAGSISLTAAKLHARGAFNREETLLKAAIKEYQDSGLSQSGHMAHFKTSLATCLMVQQKNDRVRPLLVSSLKIREAHAVTTGAPPAVNSSAYNNILELIKANLKLGEFDRDQSNFEQSEAEFAAAKKLLDVYAKDNDVLNQEYENSMADLKRQMHRGMQGGGAPKPAL